MDQSHRRQTVSQGIVNGAAYQAFATFFRHGLDAERRRFGEAHLLHAHLLGDEIIEFLGLWSSCLPLYARIDILGILPENTHVDLLGMLDRRFNATEIAHRTLAYIKVERLAKSHVQRTDSSAHGCHQRSLDAYQVIAECVKRGLWKPFACLLVSLATGKHLHPFYPTLALIGFFYGSIDHILADRSDFLANAVTFYKWYSCHIRHNQFSVLFCYLSHDIFFLRLNEV